MSISDTDLRISFFTNVSVNPEFGDHSAARQAQV